MEFKPSIPCIIPETTETCESTDLIGKTTTKTALDLETIKECIDEIRVGVDEVEVDVVDVDDNIGIVKLTLVKDYLNESISPECRQDLSNYGAATFACCANDKGKGLKSGGLTDFVVTALFKKHNLSKFREHHIKDADLMICDVPLSLKKVTGKSQIGLDWSKNPESAKKKNPFESDIMIINLKGEKWWKQKPGFTDEIKSGIYLVDASFCRKHVDIDQNNKTNTLIKPDNVYKMIKHSIERDLFIELPPPNRTFQFDILSAFSD